MLRALALLAFLGFFSSTAAQYDGRLQVRFTEVGRVVGAGSITPRGSTAVPPYSYTMWAGQAAPPGAPQNLTATVSGTTATFNWQPPSTGGVPTSYVLEASFAPGGPLIASLPLAGTSLTVPDVPNGVYYVRVRAVNEIGPSTPSNEVIVVVPGGGGACTTAPNAPHGLTGSVAGALVSLNWSPPSAGCAATGYIVLAGSGSGLSNIAQISVGLQTTLGASAPNGTYFIRIVASNRHGTSAPSNEVAVTVGPATRSAVDRPDDVTGHQVKVMYVLPSDGADQGLDTNGSLTRTVQSFQLWLRRQSNGQQLRLDTFQGEIDITFVRLPRSNATIMSFGALVRDEVERDLTAMGFRASNKIYAVYYGGGSTWSCGGGPGPLVGRVAAVFLNGAPAGFLPCNTNSLTSNVDSPGYWEFAMLHEIMHTLGVVAECAPNHTLAGHTSDSSTDLMWSGSQPWRPAVLDVNRDDYYRHGRSCLDLAASTFLTPGDPGAVPPPSWPFDRPAAPDLPPAVREAFVCRLLPPQ